MKIYALNSYANKNNSLNKSKLRQNPVPAQNQPAFKGYRGQAIGGAFGGALIGLAATSLVSMLTSSAMILGITTGISYLVGILLGSKVGDKIEGDDHWE